MKAKIVFKEVALSDIKEGDTIIVYNLYNVFIFGNIRQEQIDNVKGFQGLGRAEIEVDGEELKLKLNSEFYSNAKSDNNCEFDIYSDDVLYKEEFDKIIFDLLTNLGIKIK